MNRFCIAITALCLCLVFSCTAGGDGSPLTGQDSDNEEELALTDPDEDAEEIPELLAAEFLSGKFVSGTEIEFEFSYPVKVLSLSFDPPLEIATIEDDAIKVKVCLEKEPEPGLKLTAGIEAEDEWENVISVQAPLFARNSRVPELQINELRTEYSKPRAEFIEFKILSGGNLGALRVFAAGNGTSPMIYQFAPMEVNAGDYVVIHLRTLEEGLCADEYSGNPGESGGTDSCPSAFDFWIPGSLKLLRKTDAVYVLDQDDNALDAVMISETPDTAWSKNYLADAAALLFEKDAFKSPLGEVCRPADAVDSSAIKTSATRSISRNEAAENSASAADWYITATGGATPGLPNK